MALTIDQNIANIQAAVTQLTLAAALAKAPTPAQKAAFSAAANSLAANIADLNSRRTCRFS